MTERRNIEPLQECKPRGHIVIVLRKIQAAQGVLLTCKATTTERTCLEAPKLHLPSREPTMKMGLTELPI